MQPVVFILSENLRDNLSVPSSRVRNPKEYFEFLTLDVGTDRLSRNVDKNLPLFALS
jgi:hypothetical protein